MWVVVVWVGFADWILRPVRLGFEVCVFLLLGCCSFCGYGFCFKWGFSAGVGAFDLADCGCCSVLLGVVFCCCFTLFVVFSWG